MFFRFSLAQGLLVVARGTTDASVECDVFLPANPRPPLAGGSAGIDAPNASPADAAPSLVITFPPLGRWEGAVGRVTSRARLLRFPSSYGRSAIPVSPAPSAKSERIPAPSIARRLVLAVAFAHLALPERAPTVAPSYPALPPERPFDLARFLERVPFAYPFSTFEPLRYPEFPGVGFFRTASRGTDAEGLWLLGSVGWVQEIGEAEGRWSKRPLDTPVPCGALKAFRVEGGRFYRFSGPSGRQSLATVRDGGTSICAVAEALGTPTP